MNALNSPLDIFAINCLSNKLLTAVNNITAAVGFWRIRGLSSSSPENNAAAIEAVASAEPATDSTTKHLVTKTTSCWVLESEGSPKGKFSMYYYNDELTGVGDGGEAAESEDLGRWCGDDWERAMVVRMGDMGWYRCQDLKVLDGNVVRLWDGRRRGVAVAAV